MLAVNRLSLERYLYGVIAAEMPASWPAEALKAQAVVARSYALRSLRPGSSYDVFADVRSQVYRGVAAETAATTAAVRGTRARVVSAGGEVAQTFFFSTSGGRTATNEEAFGGAPLSYLRSVDDPHDDLSPYHTWTATFSEREANRRLRTVLLGDLAEPRRRRARRRPAAPPPSRCAGPAATGPSRRRRSARCSACAATGSPPS